MGRKLFRLAADKVLRSIQENKYTAKGVCDVTS